MARLDARLELRLDKHTYDRLQRRAAEAHTTVAELVRAAIRAELAREERSWREEALERGLALRVAVPEDPAELVRELEGGYELPADWLSAGTTGDPSQKTGHDLGESG